MGLLRGFCRDRAMGLVNNFETFLVGCENRLMHRFLAYNETFRFDDIQAILICTWEGVPLVHGKNPLIKLSKSQL